MKNLKNLYTWLIIFFYIQRNTKEQTNLYTKEHTNLCFIMISNTCCGCRSTFTVFPISDLSSWDKKTRSVPSKGRIERADDDNDKNKQHCYWKIWWIYMRDSSISLHTTYIKEHTNLYTKEHTNKRFITISNSCCGFRRILAFLSIADLSLCDFNVTKTFHISKERIERADLKNLHAWVIIFLHTKTY